MIAEEDDGSGWEDGCGRTVSNQLLHRGKAEATGSHAGLMLRIPVKATLPRANASDPAVPLDMVPDELSPFTPASSSFGSTPGTEHSFAGDQELPFASIEPREDWPSNLPRAPDLLDLNSQNGTECRQHDEDIQDLLVGPEGALLDELEEAWGQPYPNHLSVTTLTRYCPGMCVPMHTRCRGRSRSTSFDRSMRDAKYFDLGASDASNSGSRTSRVLSLPNISLESYLVAGTASPPPAGLTLRDDGSLSTLNYMLEKPIVINTREPVQPPIHVTLVDSLPVFVTTYANGVSLLRQMDSDYINLSALVSIARPPLSPSEVTQLIESCLTRRVIPRRSALPSSSGSLAGTWVPLPDAQAFCVSGRLKIPGKILEHFLQDNLADLFPDPLPELARTFKSAGVNMTDFNSLAIPSDLIVSGDIPNKDAVVSGSVTAERSNTSLSDGVVVSTGGSVPKRRPGRPKATAASRSRKIAATAPVTTRQQSRPNTRAGLRSAGLS
ncbi:hypothetical protein BS47DRAFT_1336642 [Hydnum rufescens UP504]|uniref:HTH APSES-type domain-containing protein n=1 Tax=Hydnum rufescens UP504 TaxID=1448309 RepID=A0A9P6B8Y8_9AGAM|nr:hypothetical protein BS47DRAFT_1336642 [Hydnum rufescens UP504]